MKKMKMKLILSAVAHYVLNTLNYSIEPKALEKMLWNSIFLVKIVSGKTIKDSLLPKTPSVYLDIPIKSVLNHVYIKI